MADKMRWRTGDTNPIDGEAVDSAQTISIGDCLYLSTDDVRPADQIGYAGGLATTQELFVDSFLGVAMQRSRDGDTSAVRIATTGVFEFDCAAATFELGDLVGMDDNSTPDALESQKVIAVTDAARAVGVVVKRYSSNTTSVLVRITSSLEGGLQKGEASA
jgi:hypothetical protein